MHSRPMFDYSRPSKKGPQRQEGIFHTLPDVHPPPPSTNPQAHPPNRPAILPQTTMVCRTCVCVCNRDARSGPGGKGIETL